MNNKNKTIKKLYQYMLIFIFLGVFALAGNSLAAPSVSGVTVPSGTLTHGNSITITGTGFGIKVNPKPIFWDNFESGNSGVDIEGKNPVIGDAISTEYSIGTHTYSTSQLRTNSTKSVALAFISGEWRNAIDFSVVQSEYFFSFWVYYSSGVPSARLSEWNWKPWYIYGSGGGNSDAPNMAWGLWHPDINAGVIGGLLTDSTGTDNVYGGPPVNTINNQWMQVTGWLKQSS
jgi:hypothetical protein